MLSLRFLAEEEISDDQGTSEKAPTRSDLEEDISHVLNVCKQRECLFVEKHVGKGLENDENGREVMDQRIEMTLENSIP